MVSDCASALACGTNRSSLKINRHKKADWTDSAMVKCMYVWLWELGVCPAKFSLSASCKKKKDYLNSTHLAYLISVTGEELNAFQGNKANLFDLKMQTPYWLGEILHQCKKTKSTTEVYNCVGPSVHFYTGRGILGGGSDSFSSHLEYIMTCIWI